MIIGKDKDALIDDAVYRPIKSEVGQLDTTIDEWKAALEQPDDPGQTIREIQDATGIPETTLRRRLRELIEARKCVLGMATRKDSTGRTQRYPVYQLIGEEK